MAETKGLIVEIGADTSKMNKALNRLNMPLKKIQSELKFIDKALKLDPKNVDLLKQKMKLMGDAVKQADSKVSTLRNELARLKANNAPAEQIRRLERELVMAEAEAKKLRKEFNLFKASQSTFGKLGTSLSGLGKKLNSAGHSMRMCSMYAGALAGSLGAAAYKASAYADDINTLSKQTGVATSSLQKFGAVSELVDVPLNAFAKGQGKVVSAMRKGSDAFDKYGVSIKNADGSMRSSEDVFMDYISAVSEIGNKTEQAAAMQELFGAKAYQALMPLVQGQDTFKQYIDRLNELGLVLDQDTLDKINGFKDQIDWIKSVGVLAFYKIGAAIAESIGPSLENVDKKIASFANWISKLNPVFVKVGLAISGIVAVASPLLILFGGIASGAGALFTTLSKMMPFLARLGPLLTNPFVLGGVAVGGLILAMTKLGDSGANVEKFTQTIVKKISLMANRFIKIAPQILSKFASAISKNLPILIQSAVDIINSLVNSLVKNLQPLIQGALQIVQALANGIIQNLPLIISTALKLIVTITKALIQNLPQILKAGVRIMGTLISAIGSQVGALKNKITGFAKSIPGWIKNKITGLASIGRDIVSGLWNGISNKVGWLKSKISGFVGNVKNWLKKFFKIGSPSRLMADEIGQFIPSGIAMGITDNLDVLKKATDSMGNTIVRASNPSQINYDKVGSAVATAVGSIVIDNNIVLNGKSVGGAITPIINKNMFDQRVLDGRYA